MHHLNVALQSQRSSAWLDRGTFLDLAALGTTWLLSTLIVNPVGDFPLNDDWAYGLTVKHLLDTGEFRPLGAPTAQIFSNVLWGALFCIPMGFSFDVLRLSTFVASLAGSFGCYLLVRDLNAPRWLSLLASSALAFNPIYYELSHTFMTDVGFLALTIWATFCFQRSLRTASHWQILAGTFLALAATLSRQIGLCVPFAFLIVSLFQNRDAPVSSKWLRALTPFVLCTVGLISYKWWLIATDKVSTYLDTTSRSAMELLRHLDELLITAGDHFFVASMYLGLFLSPVLLVYIRTAISFRRIQLASGAAIALLAVGAAAHASREYPHTSTLIMPVGYNILIKAGLGPDVLRDTYLLGINHRPALPLAFWIVVTAISVAGAWALLLWIQQELGDLARCFFGRRAPGDNENASRFVFLCGCLYMIPVILVPISFDEYLVPAVFFFAVSIISRHYLQIAPIYGSKWHIGALALISAFAAFSIVGSRDYLMLNRVRWDALNELQKEHHIAAREIDGGFEFNGWYLFSDDYIAGPSRSWWWVYGDTYQIGLGEVPNYKIINEFTYMNWLPPHPQKIVVLRKN